MILVIKNLVLFIIYFLSVWFYNLEIIRTNATDVDLMYSETTLQILASISIPPIQKDKNSSTPLLWENVYKCHNMEHARTDAEKMSSFCNGTVSVRECPWEVGQTG